MQVSRSEYPFEPNFLPVGSHKIHYVDEGHGEPIVMVHGNPTWSYYFRNAIKHLSSEYRCIAPDHIGCGLSDKPSSKTYTYELSQRVDDLEELLDRLGIDKDITLFLHDWGGMIGMAYAVRHPERVKRIILTNTAAFHLPKGKNLPLPIKTVRDTPIGKWLVQGLGAFSKGATRFCVAQTSMKPEIKRDFLAPYDSWNHRLAVYRFVKDIPLTPVDPSYQTVSQVEENLHRLAAVPTVILWADKDFVFDRHFLARWEELMPNAKIHRFADAGHYLLEDAWNDLRPHLDQFLRETESKRAKRDLH